MIINNKKITYYFLISISILLGLGLLFLILWGFFIEGEKNGKKAETLGQRVIYSIIDDKFINKQPEIIIKKDIPIIIEKPLKTEEIVSNQPKIVLIINNLGLNQTSTERALAMPAEITIGFSPYASKISDYANIARKNKHDILINLPLDPSNINDDAGPYALLVDLPEGENKRRLETVISLIDQVDGVYTVDEEKFTTPLKSLNIIYNNIIKKNILFVYGQGNQNTSLFQYAKAEKLPLLINDLVIDKKLSVEDINLSLQRLEELAVKNNYAIGMANGFPITLNILEKWVTSLENKNIKLIPVTTMYKEITHKLKSEDKNK